MEVSFKDIYKVVIANPLVRLGYRNSSSGFGIVFVNAKGDSLMYFFNSHYSKQDIETLFSFFKKEDTLRLGRASFDQVKEAVIKN